MLLENATDSDDDADSPERGLVTSGFGLDDLHPSFSRLGNESLRGNRGGSTAGGGSRRKTGKGTASMNKVRYPSEVNTRLCSITMYVITIIKTVE